MARRKGSKSDASNITANRLIEVAIDLFSRKGFKGASIRDIAAETDMTSANIYHCFGTKAGLLATIERQTTTPLMAELRRVSTLDLPPLDRFRLLMKTHLEFIGTHIKESKLFFLMDETLPHDEKGVEKRSQAEVFFMYRAEIDRIMTARGKERRSAAATFVTFGAMLWLSRWYQAGGRLPLEEVIREVTDLVLYGLIGEGSDREPAS